MIWDIIWVSIFNLRGYSLVFQICYFCNFCDFLFLYYLMLGIGVD